ncbi:MAG: metallophosphoesterase [Clostridia bacterium]|nr:metallophosphoesterase [Clostridia bacterium]
MKKLLALVLSLLMVITTLSGAMFSFSASAESISSVDLMNAELWNTNPASQYMKVSETTEDDYSVIKVSITQYNTYHIDLELDTNTEYSFIFDFKSPVKIENVQIWPTKCGAGPSANGSIVWDTENYTAADRILFAGGYDGTNNLSADLGHTTYDNWYEENGLTFTTNATDTSYQIFFKMNGFVNKTENSTDVIYFKNASVGKCVTATAKALGNGSATVSKDFGSCGEVITYSAEPFEGEIFKGWYNGATLLTTEKVYNHTLVEGDNILTAKFSTNDLMKVNLWEKSPNKASIKIENAVEDDFNTIKLSSIDWNFFYINMELNPNTTYKFSYDVKTALKFEDLQIWPTKCGGTSKSDGNITYDTVNYTTADRLLQITSFTAINKNQTWFENNTFEFTTNATDTSYQLFLKFTNQIDKTTDSSSTVYFKNVLVKEKVTANALSMGNGDATVSVSEGETGDPVTYTATPDALENFVGWYNKDYALVSTDATYNTTLVSGTNTLTARFTTKDNMNVKSWNSNPLKASIKVSGETSDNENVIKVVNADYNHYFIDAELKPKTEYQLIFDFKSALKFEQMQIWPTKCGCYAKTDGNVAYDTENYTTADRILWMGGYDGTNNLSKTWEHTDPNVWYEDIVISFTTNATDTSYQIYFKMNGFVDKTQNANNEVYFKNVSITDPNAKSEDFKIVSEDVNGETIADVNDLSAVETVATDNGDGTVTAKVIYENNSDMLIFKGWYENGTLKSNSESYTFNTNEVNYSFLTANFVNRNILIGAGGFETYGAGESLRVSPAGEGVLPNGGSFGMWSNWPNNEANTPGYECESTNYQVGIASGEQKNLTYLSSLVWDSETDETAFTTDTVSVSPHSGNKMLRISAPYRSMVRKIDNLKPNSNYTLSFYVWNPDRWNCLRTAVISDTVDLKTYLVENDASKTYDYYKGMSAVIFNPDTGLDEDIPVREWQKITLNFTTDADDEYLYLHLSFTRNNSGGSTGNVYFDDMVCTEDVFANSGNAIRAKDSALRYKFAVPNEFLAKYYEGATLNKVGLLVDTNEENLLVGSALKEAAIGENNYQYVDGDSSHTYFTAALYNIGKKGVRTDYTAYGNDYKVRPYVVYEKADGTQFTIYGDTVTANIFDVMYQIKYQSTSEEDVATVDAMLQNEALYNAYTDWQPTDYFYAAKSTASDYVYSMAVVGDIQITSYKHTDELHHLYDWILDNKDDKNIQYVLGLGDITDQDNDWEYAAVEEQLKRLQNAGIDQSIVRGNHDWHFNDYITFEEYGNGLVSFDGTMRNTYRLTTIGGVKYMMLTLDFFPTDDAVNWAAEAIEAHPDYNVILTTHAYYKTGMIIGDGELQQDEDLYNVPDISVANSGQDLYDKLVSRYSNIVLVMCGHASTEDYGPAYEISERADGSKVVQMMINHQQLESVDGRSYGMLAMLYFKNDGKTVSLEYFSTANEMYYMDKFQYEFQLDLID